MEVSKVSTVSKVSKVSKVSSRNRGKLHEESTSFITSLELGGFCFCIDMYLKSLLSRIAEIEMYLSLEIQYLQSYDK